MRLEMQKIGHSAKSVACTFEGVRLDGQVRRVAPKLFVLEGRLHGEVAVVCARSAQVFNKTMSQDLKLLLCDGMFDPKQGLEGLGVDALDTIECFDGIIDFEDILRSEVQSIQADYHYLDQV
ncbi:hypothetical protein [Helicobacter heilmannii]|uniref:Uncharacterized protein n=1 Tax=Helicobacter heilmannii TaxID=35817 RepID=A0A0K2Y7W8_HELHE|nr:hypothetical protein [Helicobacter heilmannii]BDQ27215.1 hypothetical protein ASB1_08910 [Helicobacter heilmannii]CCM12158.1 hypothetical protein BN341_4760 [Helicobacter heilmannii ASB1.4]CRI34212.1 hypothetical protein HHE01_10580 [Helicobacter heilmannii]